MVRLALCNLSLKSAPHFSTQIDQIRGTCEIVRTAAPTVGKFNRDLFGALLRESCAQIVNALNPPNRDQILEGVSAGNFTFLFNDSGDFIHESMFPLAGKREYDGRAARDEN
jgi:hypothetical protein